MKKRLLTLTGVAAGGVLGCLLATNFVSFGETSLGEQSGQAGALMQKMMAGARAPAAGGQVSQAFGDTGDLGGLHVQAPAQAAPYMMLHALRS